MEKDKEKSVGESHDSGSPYSSVHEKMKPGFLTGEVGEGRTSYVSNMYKKSSMVKDGKTSY